MTPSRRDVGTLNKGPLAQGLGREPQSARGLGGVQVAGAGLSPSLGVGSSGVPAPRECAPSQTVLPALGGGVQGLSPHVLGLSRGVGHWPCPRLIGWSWAQTHLVPKCDLACGRSQAQMAHGDHVNAARSHP